ncbi:MAG: hypothetical protein M1504_00065 [Candidatus Marsarchaeota archaeon]|nr:hypothetical protein [Candidatus Marsarchaeota archaeon]
MAQKKQPKNVDQDPQPASQQQDPPQQAQPVAAQKAPGSRGKMPIIIGAVVIVVIAIAAMLLLGGGVLGGNSSGQYLYSLLSSKNANASAIANAISTKISQTNTFYVNYSGTAVLNGSGGMLGGVTLTMPFSLGYMKYYNDSKVSILAKHIPLLGNLSAILVSEQHGKKSYSCINQSEMSGLGGLIGGSSNTSAKGFVCMSSQSSGSTFNVSQIKEQVLNSSSASYNGLHLIKVATSSFNGQACVLVVGNAIINPSAATSIASGGLSGLGAMAANASQKEALNFTTCLSSTYYIPLNLTMLLQSNEGTFSLTMHETAIGSQVNDSQITTLPGPIRNNSYSSYSNYGNGNNGFSTTTATTFSAGTKISSIFSGTGSSVNYDEFYNFLNDSFNTNQNIVLNYSGSQKTMSESSTYGPSNYTTEQYLTFGRYGTKTSYETLSYSTGPYQSYSGSYELYDAASSSEYSCFGFGTSRSSINYTCSSSPYPFPIIPAVSLYQNFPNPYMNSTITVKDLGQATYNGQGCTLVQGIQPGGQAIEEINFISCISNSDGMPLNLTYTATYSYDGSTSINTNVYNLQSSTASSSAAQAATTLPGPISTT